MKILQILPELNVGGVETGTVDFAKYLVEHGHQSFVISNGGTLVEELERSGSRHFKLSVHKKSIFTAWKMVKAVRQIIIDEKVEIVHARSRVPAWIAFLACRKTQAAFITTCHGYYKSRLFSQIMGWARIIIVPSEVIGRHMRDFYKVPAENIRCIPRSVDLTKYNFPREEKRGKSEFVITMVGRITRLKGHGYFIKAMAKVIRHVPYLKVWIIGDVPKGKESYKEELQRLINQLGIADKVEFLGNRKDVPQLLAKSDVLVMSSIVPESFGRVILEGQAAGVPVVATRVGGVVDIIDHEYNGLLVPPEDPDNMAEAILRLLRDKSLVDQLTANAIKRIHEKFTLEHMASKTLEVYEELRNTMSILVIKISSIGDVVLVTASLKALKEKFPHAKIYCLVGKESRKILQNCPYLAGLIIYDPKYKDKGFLRLFKMAHRLRRFQFDKIVDFQNNRKSHLLAFLSFPRYSYGYDNGKWGKLLTNRIENKKKNIPPVEHQFQILKMLDIPYQGGLLELWPSKQDEQFVQKMLDEEWMGNSKYIVGINMSASERWESKNWPIEYTAKLCDMLAKENIRVFVTGIEKDKAFAQQLLRLSKSKIADFVGKTDVMQLAALVKRANIFITPDSAPVHIAAAMRTPFLVFFGPTDSQRHLPPARKFSVLEKKPSCAPCYSTTCKIKTHVCMKDISPEEVFKKIEELL